MAGLYIHIPFCKSRCIYCGFYSTVDLNLRQQYVDALCKEMTLRPSSEPIKTIYLGGGTPSQLSIPQLRQLFLYINKVYGNDAEEITIEMNPDDVTMEYATILSQLGINRVSMGAQTFDNQRLRFLHRRHQAEQEAHRHHAGQRQAVGAVDAVVVLRAPVLGEKQHPAPHEAPEAREHQRGKLGAKSHRPHLGVAQGGDHHGVHHRAGGGQQVLQRDRHGDHRHATDEVAPGEGGGGFHGQRSSLNSCPAHYNKAGSRCKRSGCKKLSSEGTRS